MIEIFGALILGFLTLGVGSYFELVGKLADKFPVADALGQAPWMDTFFSLLIIFMAALVVVKLLWGRATEGAGVPEDVNWGCGALIGLILIGLLFWSTSSGNADNPLNTWVLGGGIIGFLLSFIPGPPLS